MYLTIPISGAPGLCPDVPTGKTNPPVPPNFTYPVPVCKNSVTPPFVKFVIVLSLIASVPSNTTLPVPLASRFKSVLVAEVLTVEPSIVTVSYTHLTLPTTPYV